MKAELEDLAFRFLEPEEYKALSEQVAAEREAREQMIDRLRRPLEDELKRAGIAAEVTGRPKHLWSIEQKMKRRGKPFDEIYDLMAVRVIVATVPECYHVLGIIHHNWTPLQERIKDYIASPKSNAYQSLHTTIFGPGGELFEVQIRTKEMHRTAEYGIAAHWVYKNEGKGDDELDQALGWFRQLLELQQDTHTPEEFLEFLKVDLYQDEIFMFTPQGDVKRLPKGATPIDFAFHVHTEVGLKCQGAKINGRIAPLHRELKNGDTVEILTSQHARPSRDWLNHVHTARARHKIKQWIREEEESVSLQMGREILARETRRRRLDAPAPEQLERGAVALGLHSGTALEIAIGRGDVAIGQVFRVLYPDRPPDELAGPEADRLRPPGGPDPPRPRHQDSRGRRPHGAVRPVLPAGAGRSGVGLRDAGPGHLDSPRRLSQPADAELRGAAGGHRLAGGGGRGLLGAAGALRGGSAGALRRHHVGHQFHRHQHPVGAISIPRTAPSSAPSSSRSTTSRISRRC